MTDFPLSNLIKRERETASANPSNLAIALTGSMGVQWIMWGSLKTEDPQTPKPLAFQKKTCVSDDVGDLILGTPSDMRLSFIVACIPVTLHER